MWREYPIKDTINKILVTSRLKRVENFGEFSAWLFSFINPYTKSMWNGFYIPPKGGTERGCLPYC